MWQLRGQGNDSMCSDNGLGEESMSQENLRRFAQHQLEEIDKYKWIMGVELGYDPLCKRSYNDIACEWIQMHAAHFRNAYHNRYFLPRQQPN